MPKFPGLCVGGPMDGKLYECHSPNFILAQHTRDDFEYQYVPTDEGVHFWILKGETLSSALTKLAIRYIETTG